MSKKMSYKKLRKKAKKRYSKYPIFDQGENEYSQQMQEILEIAGLRSSNQMYQAYEAPMDTFVPHKEKKEKVSDVRDRELIQNVAYIRNKYRRNPRGTMISMMKRHEFPRYITNPTGSHRILTNFDQIKIPEDVLLKFAANSDSNVPERMFSAALFNTTHRMDQLSDACYTAYMEILEDVYIYLVTGGNGIDSDYEAFLLVVIRHLHAFLIDYAELDVYTAFDYPWYNYDIDNAKSAIFMQTRALSGFYVYHNETQRLSKVIADHSGRLFIDSSTSKIYDKTPKPFKLMSEILTVAPNTKILGVSVFDMSNLMKIIRSFMIREHEAMIAETYQGETPPEEKTPAKPPFASNAIPNTNKTPVATTTVVEETTTEEVVTETKEENNV